MWRDNYNKDDKIEKVINCWTDRMSRVSGCITVLHFETIKLSVLSFIQNLVFIVQNSIEKIEDFNQPLTYREKYEKKV